MAATGTKIVVTFCSTIENRCTPAALLSSVATRDFALFIHGECEARIFLGQSSR